MILRNFLKTICFLFLLQTPFARSAEILALAGFGGSNAIGSSSGFGGALLGHFDLGVGQVETGVIYAHTDPAYWTVPLLYRFYLVPPFLSLGVGPDYAFTATSGYKSNVGIEASLQAKQELGNDLGLVIDLRYRYGISDAITVGDNSYCYRSYTGFLGIQKRFE